MASGLAKHIQYKRKLIDAREAEPTTPRPSELNASVTAEGRSGIRRVRIRDFQIVSDGGAAGGGFNLGPFPGELLIASLAGCINHGYLLQAAKRDIVLDAVTIHASATIPAGGIDFDSTDPVDINWSYEAEVSSPHSDEELEELRKAVEHNSFVYNVVTRGAAVSGSIRNTATDEAK